MAILADSSPSPRPVASRTGAPTPAPTLNAVDQGMLNWYAANGGAAAAGSGRQEGRVYWGTSVPTYQPRGTYDQEWLTETQALEEFDKWDEKKLNDFIAQGIVGGLIQSGGGEVEARRVWGQLVADAGRYGLRGNPVSPFDILSQYVDRAGGVDKGQWVDKGNGMQQNVITGEVRYVGPKFRTVTATSTDLTDPDTARALTTSVFQSMLGRNPMPGELAQFASALNTAEQNAPATTHTTYEYDSEGNQVGSTSYTEGGLSGAGKEYLLQQEAKKNPEYGATQAATTYMNAFERAIWG